MNRFRNIFFASIMLLPLSVFAQKGIQFNRPVDQRGINVFESSKADTVEFTGLKLKIGGNFTQQFQSISHSNTADVNDFPFGAGTVDLKSFIP
jgi:hypothetical protein